MAHRRSHAMTAAVAAVALAACGGSDSGQSSGWRSTVDTLGDTVVVRTMAGSVWGNTASLEEQVRIGVLEGADEYILGSVCPASQSRRRATSS